jgi:hypothetical protein
MQVVRRIGGLGDLTRAVACHRRSSATEILTSQRPWEAPVFMAFIRPTQLGILPSHLHSPEPPPFSRATSLASANPEGSTGRSAASTQFRNVAGLTSAYM